LINDDGLFFSSVYLNYSEFLAVKKFEVRIGDQHQQMMMGEKALQMMQQRWKKEVELMYEVIDCPYVV